MYTEAEWHEFIFFRCYFLFKNTLKIFFQQFGDDKIIFLQIDNGNIFNNLENKKYILELKKSYLNG